MEHLIILHGAIGAADQLVGLAPYFNQEFEVHVLNFSGHGGVALPPNGFSISEFGKDVIDYMNDRGIASAHILGYSMGGYVGLYVARHYADRVVRVVTMATKFGWNEEIAAKEVLRLNAEKISAKVPAFAATLAARHMPNDWKEVLVLTAEMMLEMGRNNPLKMEDYNSIQQPVLLLLGDRDKMVTMEETLSVYRLLPNAQLGVLPGTPHPIEQVDIALLAHLAARFLKG